MRDDMPEIGPRIRELRVRRGITQAELADAIGASDASVVSKIESGVRGLAANELAAICARLGVTSDHVLFGGASATGVLLRAEASADARRAIARVEDAFADLRYVRALVES